MNQIASKITSHLVTGDLTPNPEYAAFLKNVADRRMISSIRYLAGVVERGIGRDVSKVVCSIDELLNDGWSNSERISSLVHIQHTILKGAIEKNDICFANEALNEIEKLSFLTGNLKFGALSGSEWDDNQNKYILNALNASSVKTYGKTMGINPPDEIHARRMKSAIRRALDVLGEIDELLYREIVSVTTDIVYFQSSQTTSGSSFNCLGLMSMNCISEIQNWTTALEMIVHEATHQHVYNLMVSNRIILNEGEAKFRSALRKDLRPLSGIFHAMVVLARIIYTMSKLDQSGILKRESIKIMPPRNNALNTDPYLFKFNDLLEVIEQNAELSNVGWEVVDSCKKLTR